MAARKGRFKRFLLYTFFILLTLILIGSIYFYFRTKIEPPEVADKSALNLKVTKVTDTYFTIGNNWIKKNKGGLWEMYVEGEPFERGVIIGKLAEPLIRKQEVAFISQIKKIIPSEFYLKFLKYFIAWFNRDIDTFIPEEYKLEIYGESFAASHDYDFIGDPYHRILNYHGAHDIGHAIQDKNLLVGCSALAVWGNKTTDSTMIIGRNWDFYVGDDFAEDKMVIFFNPSKGSKFMIVTWGGMIGAVSGMNEHGLTVALNAGRSDIPTAAATPIAILTREILQYATNIDEAYAIAKKRKSFVSESLIIGSLKDGKTAIIEKSPNKIDIVYPENNGNEIICTNHFRGDAYKDDQYNLTQIKESASFYRYNRMTELLNTKPKLDYKGVAAILRDQKGQKGVDIGMGNELAVNQLISHHSIIFEPEKSLAWVSSNPLQLGTYYAYNLNEIFSKQEKPAVDGDITIDSLNIPEDTFLTSGYKKFLVFKGLKNKITEFLSNDEAKDLTNEELTVFQKSNPEYYYTYSLLGDYYKKKGDKAKAEENYKLGLSKVIATKQEKDHIVKQLQELKN
jgi:isopenicillin-N N-acyltransferase like protein